MTDIHLKETKMENKLAETLVCPFIAERGEDASGYTVFSKHIKCITGNCMAWKDTTKKVYTEESQKEYDRIKDMQKKFYVHHISGNSAQFDPLQLGGNARVDAVIEAAKEKYPLPERVYVEVEATGYCIRLKEISNE